MSSILLIPAAIHYPGAEQGWALLEAAVRRELIAEEHEILARTQVWIRAQDALPHDLDLAVRAAALHLEQAERRAREDRQELAALRQAAQLLADRREAFPGARLGDLVGAPIGGGLPC